MQSPELRPLRIGEVIDVALKVYLRNARTLMKIVLVVVAPVQFLSALVSASTIPEEFTEVPASPFQPVEPGEVPEIEARELGVFFAANGIIAVLGGIAVLLATAACFKAVSDAYLGATPEWKGSLKFAGRRLHSVVWVSILSWLGIILGFLALVIPGIWLWVAWAVAVPALLMEGLRGRRALGRSFRLVRHRWWPTFAAILLGFILAGIVQSIIQFAFGALLFTDVGDNLFLSMIVGAVAATLAGVIATPFQAALVVVIYFDLRVRKEGFDLELLAQRVGVSPARASPDFLPPPPKEEGDPAKPPFWPPPPGWEPPDPK